MDASDVQAVEQLFEQFVAAFNEGDLETLRASYTDDALVVPPARPQPVDRMQLSASCGVQRLPRLPWMRPYLLRRLSWPRSGGSSEAHIGCGWIRILEVTLCPRKAGSLIS